MECRASHQNTSDAMTGHSSKPQEVSNRRLGLVGERMLWDWFQSERNTVWEEAKVNAELHNLALVLEQQSAVDSGICLDQWALGRTQSAQPFNDLKQQLISSISLSRQASTILMANTDYLAGHCHQIKQATTDATPKAFLPVRERDLFNLGSQPTIMGEINPAYQDPLFPDFCRQSSSPSWETNSPRRSKLGSSRQSGRLTLTISSRCSNGTPKLGVCTQWPWG